MAAITKFEDLIAWQEARTLVKMAYKLTSDGSFSKDLGCVTKFGALRFLR